MTVHGVAMLTDRGLSAGLAAGVMSTVALAGTLRRIAGGYLMDIFPAPRVAAGVFVLAAAGAAMLLFGVSSGWCWAAMTCIGLGAGADVDVLTYLVSG